MRLRALVDLHVVFTKDWSLDLLSPAHVVTGVVVVISVVSALTSLLCVLAPVKIRLRNRAMSLSNIVTHLPMTLPFVSRPTERLLVT